MSQSVRQLEEELRVVLMVRTTRSVSLTDAGRRLLESTGPAVAQVRAALTEVTAKPGEVVGRVRLTVPRSAFHFVIEPVLPRFRQRHPRIEVEVVFEDRRVDIVGEGFDAGIRLSEYVERDMVSVRLTDGFRFLVVEGITDPVVRMYFDYYRTPRGFHERSPNSSGAWTATSPMSFMNLPLLTYIDEISQRPILLIHGANAHSRYFSEDAYKAAAEPKELLIVKDADHVDLYDRLDKIPFGAITEFFGKSLQ